MTDETLIIQDENGQESVMTILFTFDFEDSSYVLYYPEGSEDDEIFVSRYDDEGGLYPVEDEDELAMVQEVLNTFSEEDDA